MIASAVALDVLVAFWALLTCLANEIETRLFLLRVLLILQASLVLGTRNPFVGGTIAADACLRTTLVADTDVINILLLPNSLALASLR